MKAALAELPSRYTERLANVDFVVRRVPSRLDRKRLGLRGTIYGLYEGVPLTRRDSSYDRVLPDRISIFYGPLVRDFTSDDSLAAEVRNTLYHEIAHYFGLDEHELDDTSVR